MTGILYVGVDVHRKDNHFHCLDPSGKTIASFKQRNNRPGTERAIIQLTALLQQHSCDELRLAAEATNWYWLPFFQLLASDPTLNQLSVKLYAFNPLPAKMQYDAALYATINNSLYRTFGAAPGIAIEIGSILSAAALAFLVRKSRPALLPTLAGALCLLLAQVIWWVFIFPVNVEIRMWTAATVPADWMRLRNQWEYTHATRFVLQLLGLSALILSILREIPTEQTVPTTGRPNAMRAAGR